MEFIREDKMTGLRYSAILSPDKKFSFRLLKDWKIKWQQDHFAAESSDGHTLLKGSINIESKPVSFTSGMEEMLEPYTIKQTGLEHTENFGAHQWKEKSFLCVINNKLRQVITLQSTFEKSNICFILITSEGDLTINIQETVNTLLDSIKER